MGNERWAKGRCYVKVKPIYRQWGAKASIAPWVVSHFPKHKVYVEPFAGSCAVLFAKEPAFQEVVNDMDERLINIFRKIRENPFELAALVWGTPYAKGNWKTPPRGDLERAALDMARSVQFYCGDVNTSTFSIDACSSPHKPKADVWGDWAQRILPAAARLKHVTILNEDAIACIKRFSGNPDALLYIDPPYVGHEREYAYRIDYQAMVMALKKHPGPVVVSEYEAAAQHYDGWEIKKLKTVGRARTGAHNTKAKSKEEFLFIKQRE